MRACANQDATTGEGGEKKGEGEQRVNQEDAVGTTWKALVRDERIKEALPLDP